MREKEGGGVFMNENSPYLELGMEGILWGLRPPTTCLNALILSQLANLAWLKIVRVNYLKYWCLNFEYVFKN